MNGNEGAKVAHRNHRHRILNVKRCCIKDPEDKIQLINNEERKEK